eukprot:CAMPEP_0202707386 /NCGR_PEP_ID=MMETSP1385-20130828/19720_1 /ASSEMBLY_ACC=CAM_ASM_000861 /TAXON_ID=933848 /ORGANISM="Elphidium margaritaceum" /LENGTH=264 /DNA_ID=CAMNT_0049366093 /DNA_START=152 /DNA_END=946 /DNA_ORIENTATION=+
MADDDEEPAHYKCEFPLGMTYMPKTQTLKLTGSDGKPVEIPISPDQAKDVQFETINEKRIFGIIQPKPSVMQHKGEGQWARNIPRYIATGNGNDYSMDNMVRQLKGTFCHESFKGHNSLELTYRNKGVQYRAPLIRNGKAVKHVKAVKVAPPPKPASDLHKNYMDQIGYAKESDWNYYEDMDAYGSMDYEGQNVNLVSHESSVENSAEWAVLFGGTLLIMLLMAALLCLCGVVLGFFFGYASNRVKRLTERKDRTIDSDLAGSV